VRSRLCSLLLLILSCATISAQQFTGHVKKADSTSSPIFQAKVDVTEGGKPFTSLKTYFDGSFKFKPNSNQEYTIKISYSGYTDTSYTITTDKNAKPSAQNVVVKLKKDGMRLMGIIKSRNENFPIKDATIVLKNVMTQKENRITTGIDGRYNFKLEYETNYKVWIDKRSPGVANTYRDTAFYVSTIGFNMPLDYKLDISLDLLPELPAIPDHGNNSAREYFRIRKPEKPIITSQPDSISKNIVIAPSTAAKEEKAASKLEEAKPKTTQPEVAVLQEQPAKNRREDKGDVVIIKDSAAPPHAKTSKRKKKPVPDVVVIRDDTPSRSSATDSPQHALSTDLLEITRQKAIAEKKAREEEARKVAEESARKKFIEDSLINAKQHSDSLALEMVQKQKVQDSLQRAKTERDRIAKQLLIQKPHQDTISKFKPTPKPITPPPAAPRDSIHKFQKPLAPKTFTDSFARKQKVIDSIQRAKTERDRIAKQVLMQKLRQDSIAKLKPAPKPIAPVPPAPHDSIRKFQKPLAPKTFSDSFARKQKVIDSIQRAKIAKELMLKQRSPNDSIAKFKPLPKPVPQDSPHKIQKSAPPKSSADSLPSKPQVYFTKTQEQLIAAAEAFAKHKKLLQDSISKAKGLEIKKDKP
jgi:hypothetical protein